MKNNRSQSFKTTDLALSAYLLARGHNLAGLERNGKNGVFIFRKEDVEKDSQLYLNGKARIEPGIFNLSIRRLKARLNEMIFN